ncbi:protein serine threonine [Stylonychia lemnae]|uniref:Protein serine threonine n=1 Tax=Stylonychia lemnae TaxID=5949 RepID=A0A077ZSW4_STYLE|nr:protein serine threonine [Stylonychia lemnae]|eukprot:CDW72977.1 protein serine threonine [Stylonychia lemnae]
MNKKGEAQNSKKQKEKLEDFIEYGNDEENKDQQMEQETVEEDPAYTEGYENEYDQVNEEIKTKQAAPKIYSSTPNHKKAKTSMSPFKHLQSMTKRGQKFKNNKSSDSEVKTDHIFQSYGTETGRTMQTQTNEGKEYELQAPRMINKILPIFFTILKLVATAISMSSMIMNIVYSRKVIFFSSKSYMMYMLIILLRPTIIFRYVCDVFVNYCSLCKCEDLKSDKDSANRKERLLKILHLFGSMFLFQMGTFRICHEQYQRFLILEGLIVEAFQVAILLIIQHVNNESMNFEMLNLIQKTCIALAFANLLSIIIQLRSIIAIIIDIVKKRKQNKEYLRLDTKEKIDKFFRKDMINVMVSLLIFIIVLTAVMKKLPDRKCLPGMGFNQAVCESCIDKKCLQCDEDFATCSFCERGYFITPPSRSFQKQGGKNQCTQCLDPGCYSCDSEGECQICQKGYRYLRGQCISCGMQQNCAFCNDEKCLTCKDGFFLDRATGACLTCNTTLPYCNKCTDSNTCDDCAPVITAKRNGKCTCNSVYNWYQAGTSECLCQGYVMSQTDYCSTCEQLIPGCQKCIDTNVSGTDSILVGQTSIAPLQKMYVKCEKCQISHYFDTNSKRCEQCAHITDNCESCDEKGQQCTKCLSGYYINWSDQDQENICYPCSYSIDNCVQCDGKNMCSKCKSGFEITKDYKCQVIDQL